jgi:hypothetical protein
MAAAGVQAPSCDSIRSAAPESLSAISQRRGLSLFHFPCCIWRSRAFVVSVLFPGSLSGPEFAVEPRLGHGPVAAKSASGKLTCTETLDRSYYSRSPEPLTRPPCEKPVLDSKRGRSHLKLVKTDRLRVAVTFANGHEIYFLPASLHTATA